MRTATEHISASEFIFNMEVLDEDFDFDDDIAVTDVMPDAEFNHTMEDMYG